MVVKNPQKSIFLFGLNFFLIKVFLIIITKRIKIEAAIASTPPSLEGIERRMA